MIWDSRLGTLKVLDRRINKILASICSLRQSPSCRVRELHSFVGQIISLSPVVGNVTRLMTRNCQSLIALHKDENTIVTPHAQCLKEIQFWQENAARLNNRDVFVSPKVNKIICSDASSLRSGAILCNDNHVAHKNLTFEDMLQSSTWRELETILFALHSFVPFLFNSRTKLFTDNQAAAKIIETGSMKCHLQGLAYNIFEFCLKKKNPARS